MKITLLIATYLSVFSLKASLLDVPHLSLTATAHLCKPADELQLKITLITTQDSACAALEENTQKINNILARMLDLGLSAQEYQTDQFSITPTYTPCPQHPPLNWKPSINGYQVSYSILVRTTQLDIIGQIIDSATQEGATHITDIRFGLRNPNQYQTEALSIAGANALKNAQTMAASMGVKLIRVLSMNLNPMRVSAPQMQMACFAKSADNNSAPPIEGGEVCIDASLSVVYEIN